MYFVGVSRGTGVIPRVVRTIMGTEWYHPWIAYHDDRWGRTMVVHATPGGVKMEPLENIEDSYPAAVHYEVKHDLGSAVLAAGKNIGAAYDWRSVSVNLALIAIKRVTGKAPFAPARSESKFHCCEFVLDALKRSGIAEVQELDPKLTTADVLVGIMNASDTFEQVDISRRFDTLPDGVDSPYESSNKR